MTRDDYLALLDRALASAHGIKLDYADDATARQVRAKLYHIREELRAEARPEPATQPAVTYAPDGQLIGVIDILRRREPPPPSPYDGLRMRVWSGSLYIMPVAGQPRRVDDLRPVRASDIDLREVAQLPRWPPWST